MTRAWQRAILVVVLGAILVGGTAGLAIDLLDAQSATHSDLERSAHERASLAAALIDSIMSGSYRGSPGAFAAISGAHISPGEVHRTLGATPLAAVLDANGRLLASWPPHAPQLAEVLAADSSLTAALASQHSSLSSLLPSEGGVPSGFLSATPYSTPHGRRIQLAWFPLRGVTAILHQYLGYVAHYAGAHVYLFDGNGIVIGSSSPATKLGRPIADGQLRAALDLGAQAGHFDGSATFYAVSGLHVAPWRVLYTVPTGALYASSGEDPTLSFLLLGGFGAAAAVCLILLARRFSRSDALARANRELAERNAEIEQANQAKSRFLANMSHELRTPLNAIIGFADLMHDERIGPVTHEHRECLDDIRSSARHLLHLINEVLDLARIESGRITLDVQSVDPGKIALECVDSLRSLASESAITVTLETGPVGAVALDPARLRQVLLNYLSNAIKFTGEGGTVRVSVRRADGELVLEVQDTGPGIAVADQERVFGEFEQLSQQRHGGTGLGLAVTKRIVEAQRGTVGVHSVSGRGSTFYARLPIIEASGNGTVPPAPPAPKVVVHEGAHR